MGYHRKAFENAGNLLWNVASCPNPLLNPPLNSLPNEANSCCYVSVHSLKALPDCIAISE